MWAGPLGDFPSRERDGTELGPWKPGSWTLEGSPMVPLWVPRREAVRPPDAQTAVFLPLLFAPMSFRVARGSPGTVLVALQDWGELDRPLSLPAK